MRALLSTSLFLSVALLAACGDGPIACAGTEADYDDAYDACFDDGQADVCAGESRGANYAQGSYDLCDDNLGDKAGDGCEAGYAAGYDGGCAS